MCKLVFGITGATGTGKSSASKILCELGVDVIDADIVARDVVKKGTDCLNEIVDEFGKEILFDNGELNRKALGNIVFSDKNKLETLNHITHKYIKSDITNRIKQSNAKMCAVDGAVLIGSNMEEMCSFMVVVVSDAKIRKKRIIERDNLTEEQAQNRINSQPDIDFYINHADYIIENNTDFDDLKENTIAIYNKIIKERIL